MSTRANVKITDAQGTALWFYRHYDGDPETTIPGLSKFMRWAADGTIRKNASQAGGWLIALGMQEYKTGPEPCSKRANASFGHTWKVGAYEPTDCQHGDINYLYIMDLDAEEIRVEKISDVYWHTVVSDFR